MNCFLSCVSVYVDISNVYIMFLFRLIRSTKPSTEDVQSFPDNVELFFQKMRVVCGEKAVKNKPYLHILRDHVPGLLRFWYDMLNWGYGYFTCMGSEHLNKQIKQIEMHETNRSCDRFEETMRICRIRQFYYSKSIFNSFTTKKCSRCNQIGHNRKNKSCPMHPDQPNLDFPDTDEE